MKKYNDFLNESMPFPGGPKLSGKPSWEDDVTYNIEADVHFYGLDESTIKFKMIFKKDEEVTKQMIQERAVERLSKEFDNIIEEPITKEKWIKVASFIIAPESEQIRPMY